MARKELWDQVDQDLYAILGVDFGATDSEIQSSWRALAKKTHPDAGGDSKDFTQAEIAYRVLSSTLERARYDRISRQTTGVAYSPSSGKNVYTFTAGGRGSGGGFPTVTKPAEFVHPLAEPPPIGLSTWKVLIAVLFLAAVVGFVILFPQAILLTITVAVFSAIVAMVAKSSVSRRDE